MIEVRRGIFTKNKNSIQFKYTSPLPPGKIFPRQGGVVSLTGDFDSNSKCKSLIKKHTLNTFLPN